MKKKILFINFGGLGDEILFLPTIISTKKEFPDSEITLAMESRSKGILSLTKIIDNTIFADIKNKNKYIELLKLLFKIWIKKFDIVISSGSNQLISMFLFLTFIPQKYGYNTGKLSELLLTKAIKLDKKQYAVKMYHDLVQHITCHQTELPQIDVNKQEIEPNTILIHPGVSLLSVKQNMIKTIPPQKWAEVIEKLAGFGKKVLLVGGPDDKETIEIIESIVPKEKYTNLYGKTKNLEELAELISKSEKFVCSDSAPLHIAVALGVKTYVIFGSTDDKKLVPQNDNVKVIKTNSTCPLQPCLWEKRQTTCDTLECLNISTEQIANQILDS